MSQNNYRNYNNYHKQHSQNIQTNPVVRNDGYQPTKPMENTTPPNVTSSVQPAPVVEQPKAEEPKPVFGVVSGCAKLNIRNSPSVNGNVVCVVDENTRLMISLSDSTTEWYSVYNSAGLNGFCMKKFVTVKQ